MKRKICLNAVENKEADYCAGGKKSFVISASCRPILASVSSRWERGHGVAYYTAAHYSREPQLLVRAPYSLEASAPTATANET